MEGWGCPSCGHVNAPASRYCGGCGRPGEATPPATPATPAPQAPAAPATPAPASAEERRLISAVFADISGFTALADRLDPEALLEIIDPVVSRLADVVARYGGYVEKYAGDALLALFGAPVAHGDDADRALLAALDMHVELAAAVRRLPAEAHDLTLHVGVASGHGIARMLGSEARMDYAVLGDSVILAQRLESHAPPGETYVSASTVELAGERFRFEPIGELSIKGKAEAVPAWRLLGPTETIAHGALVGRHAEVATLTGAVAGLTAGRGGIVAILGEPGIGKTQLAAAARDLAVERGVRCLETRGVSYGAALAYRPIAELLRAYAGLRLDDPPAAVSARLSAALADDDQAGAERFFARVLGVEPSADGPRDASEVLEPEAFARALAETTSGWLSALAEPQPVMILADDLHWFDAASLDLLRAVAETTAAHPVLLLVTCRPEGRASLDHLLAAPPGPTATELSLGPLDDDAVGTIAERVLGGPAPERLLRLLADRAAGHPFFAEELVRSLVGDGTLARAGEGWRLPPGWDPGTVPPTVEQVLAARIDRLPAGVGSVLAMAAVIGRRVRLPLLWDIVGNDVGTALVDLQRDGFLVRGDAAETDLLVFRHPLTQEVAYGRQLRRRRRELHGRVAEAARSRYGDGDDVIDLLARHLYLAEAGASAVDALVRAANRARTLFANDEAILAFERAIEVAESESARESGRDHDESASLAARLPELRLAVADLRRLVGDYAGAEAAYRSAARATDDLRAWAGVAATLRDRGDTGAALAVLDERLAICIGDVGADPRPLLLERARTHLLAGRTEDAMADARTGLARAPGPDDDRSSAGLRLQLARAAVEAEDGRLARSETLAALATFEALGDRPGLAQAYRLLGDVEGLLGDRAAARMALERGLDLARRVGSSDEIGGCLVNLGNVEADDEHWDTAAGLFRGALGEFERIDHATGRVTALANLADVLFRAGRLDEAEAEARHALEAAGRIGHTRARADALDTLALIADAAGRPVDAARHAEAAAVHYAAAGTTRRAAETLRMAAQAWTAAGDPGRASAAAEAAAAHEAHL